MRGLENFIILMVLSFNAGASEQVINEICNQVIPFAQSNKANISEKDLYHCHVLVKLKEGEEKTYSNYRTWSYFEERRQAYICHAHEKDLLRKKDNFNIFYMNNELSFWGVDYPVVEKDVLARFSLAQDKYLVSWTNIYFFPQESKFCPLISQSVQRVCGDTPVCIGLESDEYDQAQAYPEPIEDKSSDLKSWEF